MTGWSWTQVELLARRLTPGVVTLLLLIVGLIPLQIPYLAPIGPSFLLVSIYYWAVHRPELMPAWAVFGFGVVGDLLSGAPLGSGTLMLLLLYGATRRYRRALLGGGFLVAWLGFAVAAAGANLLLWGLATVLVGIVPDVRPALFGALLEIALYPVVAALFVQAERLVERSGG